MPALSTLDDFALFAHRLVDHGAARRTADLHVAADGSRRAVCAYDDGEGEGRREANVRLRLDLEGRRLELADAALELVPVRAAGGSWRGLEAEEFAVVPRGGDPLDAEVTLCVLGRRAWLAEAVGLDHRGEG